MVSNAQSIRADFKWISGRKKRICCSQRFSWGSSSALHYLHPLFLLFMFVYVCWLYCVVTFSDQKQAEYWHCYCQYWCFFFFFVPFFACVFFFCSVANFIRLEDDAQLAKVLWLSRCLITQLRDQNAAGSTWLGRRELCVLLMMRSDSCLLEEMQALWTKENQLNGKVNSAEGVTTLCM